jgi:hypothetical protein
MAALGAKHDEACLSFVVSVAQPRVAWNPERRNLVV